MATKELAHQHAQKEISSGRMVPVIVEMRRNGRKGWALLHDLHNAEKADASRLRAAVGLADDSVHIAIEPESGRVGVFIVSRREQAFDFFNGGAAPADPIGEATESASILQSKIQRSFDSAREVLQQYAEGRHVYSEDVFDCLPAGVPADSVREILRQAHLEPLDVEIAGRVETLGGQRNVPRHMPSRLTYEVLADVRSVNRDGKPNGTAVVKILAVSTPVTSAAFPIYAGVSLTVELRTTSDQRSLALLHLAAFYDRSVRLKLGMLINLSSGRTEFFIKEIDKDDLLRFEQPVQAILEGL